MIPKEINEFEEWRKEHLDFCHRLTSCCDELADLDPIKQQKLSDQIHEDAKNLAMLLNKVTKKYDKQLDLQVYWDPDEICKGKLHLLHKTIMEYLIREGNFKVVDSLVKDLKLGRDQEILKLQQHFADLDFILKEFKNRNLNPALDWATQQLKPLLSFKLHKLKYLQILAGEIEYELNLKAEKSNVTMALSYARDFLSIYYNEHPAEIKKLATCVIYKELGNTPYSEFINPILWDQVEKSFTSEFCLFVGLAPSSPLFVR
eukprot:NODE_831_length_3850_cov_0.209544.p2 type:complete len:260 gc:universal NODE_831_length_3850_cov_0.209544:2525-3304(+)